VSGYKRETVYGPGPGNIPELDLDALDKVIKKMQTSEGKKTNPKDSVGVKKAPISTVPGTVVAEIGCAMLEGARKYGRHNYRIDGVRASVYRDATWRHLNKWWEGEDIDSDSGLNHITKAIASLVVMRDGMICDKFIDDRPPPAPKGFFADMDKLALEIIEKYPDAKDSFTHLDLKKKEDKSGF